MKIIKIKDAYFIKDGVDILPGSFSTLRAAKRWLQLNGHEVPVGFDEILTLAKGISKLRTERDRAESIKDVVDLTSRAEMLTDCLLTAIFVDRGERCDD
jgi:hypothetical protein